MLRLLSLETATDCGAFALWSGACHGVEVQTQVCESVVCTSGQPHAETLLPALRTSLQQLDWALSSLDAIVFDAGPGMFTGLRVSAALAQGLALALDKPVIAVSSLETLAETTFMASGATQVLSLLDARMQQLYAGLWKRGDAGWQSAFDARLLNPSQMNACGVLPAAVVVSGTGVGAYPEVSDWLKQQGLTDSGVRYPDTEALARLGAIRFAAGSWVDSAQALPCYVRDRVALTTAERAAGLSL